MPSYKIVLSAFAAVAAALIIPPPASVLADAIERRTLPSGMHVIVSTRPGTGLVAFDLRVRVGSGSETPETNGTAHFIEHLVFKGTAARAPGEIDTAIESLGGELTAQTTRDSTRFAATLPEKGWQDALSITADMVLHPAFRDADVNTEKSVILAEMAIARTEPMRAGYAALAGALFPSGDPYRFPIMGTTDNVQHMTSDALRTFWAHWYRPENMTLAVAGDVKADDVFAAAERLFPTTGANPAVPLAAPPLQAHVVSDVSAGIVRVLPDPAGPRRELTTILLGFRAPAAQDSDNAATVTALLSLLASGADASGNGGGRLTDALVNKQKIALSISADYIPQRDAGMIIIAATGRREDAAKLEASLRAELKKIPEDGFTDDDALQGRQAISSSDATVGGRASRLAQADVVNAPADATDTPAKLQTAITSATLTAAARKYLDANNSAVTQVGSDSP